MVDIKLVLGRSEGDWFVGINWGITDKKGGCRGEIPLGMRSLVGVSWGGELLWGGKLWGELSSLRSGDGVNLY